MTRHSLPLVLLAAAAAVLLSSGADPKSPPRQRGRARAEVKRPHHFPHPKSTVPSNEFPPLP